ncbi:MAG: hypothetical protein K0S70_2439 [Microbacterium sp.]|jgi:hypothetical protein|nr:hypothetical protein [Microbacterium sp.]
MADWHPILNAEEREPGVWIMVGPLGQEYGRIEIRRSPDGIRYRTEALGREIGWGTSLRQACARAHDELLRSFGPSRPRNPEWPAGGGR